LYFRGGGCGWIRTHPEGGSTSASAAPGYARRLAQRLAATDKQRYVTSASLTQRPGRLFIDYLRNGRGTTAVGAYSPRAREGFPIAAPETWKQVEHGIKPDAFTVYQPGRPAAVKILPR
jgi:bifunctional non-homologous end joining protein LigD